jgi:TolA-binding protein
MAATQNPHTAEVTNLTAEIARLRTRIAELTASRDSYARHRDQNLEAGNQAEANADNVVVGQRNAEITALTNELNGLLDSLAAAKAAQTTWNNAVAKAIAAGMTPEAAAIKASADAQRTVVVNRVIIGVAIGLGVIAFIYGITLFIRWRKQKN